MCAPRPLDAPLQRLADRVADTAMPHVHDPAARVTPGVQDREAYRGAVEMALADGVITRAEEKALARLSARCGLTWEEALEIQEEVEAARAASDGGATG